MATPPSRKTESGPSRARRARVVTGDDRERAILETFERLLEERPLHEISIDDLARGAGLSRSSFYFYFASKDAVLLTLLDRMVEEARARRDDVLDRVAEDPRARWREAITAFHDTFRDHRAATVAAAAALPTSPEVSALWTAMMSTAVDETSRVIDAERARGAAPDGVPARDLATALNATCEAVLRATFAGQEPAIAEDAVIDTLVAVWINAVYGTPGSL
jgi:AcrR family transcriptional regulator